jgi:hypothetical protein
VSKIRPVNFVSGGLTKAGDMPTDDEKWQAMAYVTVTS